MIQREVVKIENQRVQIHLDGLIKEIESNPTASLNHSSVEDLITALRNYNIVPEHPEPVQTKGSDVKF
jgi:hypothetical protein